MIFDVNIPMGFDFDPIWGSAGISRPGFGSFQAVASGLQWALPAGFLPFYGYEWDIQ